MSESLTFWFSFQHVGTRDFFTSGLFCGIKDVLGRAVRCFAILCCWYSKLQFAAGVRVYTDRRRGQLTDDVSHTTMTSCWHLVLSLRQSRGCHESIEPTTFGVRITWQIHYLLASVEGHVLFICLSVTTVVTADSVVNGCSFPPDTTYDQTGLLSGVRNSFSSTSCLNSIVCCTRSLLMSWLFRLVILTTEWDATSSISRVRGFENCRELSKF